jgi:aspartate kinase
MASQFLQNIMTELVVAKFGGSAIGPDGEMIPKIIQRITNLKKNSKIIAVFSAPLTIHNEKKRSLTDVILEQGKNAENGIAPSLDIVKSTYQKILKMVNSENKTDCENAINFHLEKAQKALDEALEDKEFVNETRSRALAFSGEILMSHVMNYILRSNGVKAEAVNFEDWPIITDNNIEFTNFLAPESREKMGGIAEMVEKNEVVTIGGFIGKTVDNITTTYERGGSDRTAADLGILFHKKYVTSIDFEKDSSVVSADPKIVEMELREIVQLSYNEARLAGMFGMKILDPIAIKEIVENGVDVPITITNMKNPEKITTVKRIVDEHKGHPIKIVTGKENCAIFRIETSAIQKLLTSLDKDKHYSEFIILSPFTKDGIEFSRILFLDGEYVNRNEKYLLGFDSLATITYNRGVITLIGDEMWRVQQVASRTSAKIGESGLNILNMDAQEETSRIIIVIEDKEDNIRKAIRAIHQEISKIDFV